MKKYIKTFFFLIFLPISLPLWLISKLKRKKKKHLPEREYIPGISTPYDKEVDQHFQNTEAIGQMYSVAKTKGDYFSKSMEKVIQACLEDIELAPAYYKWYYRSGGKGTPPDFYSFKRLAIIYEKRKEYDKAIDICNRAIKMGFTDDGTEGGMRGRRAKLSQMQKGKE